MLHGWNDKWCWVNPPSKHIKEKIGNRKSNNNQGRSTTERANWMSSMITEVATSQQKCILDDPQATNNEIVPPCESTRHRRTAHNQPVVGWLERLCYPQPIRVQVLVVPSMTRCQRWLRKFQDDMSVQSFEDGHTDRVCVYAFIRVSVCTCIWALGSVLC